jgi:hypothetical protein
LPASPCKSSDRPVVEGVAEARARPAPDVLAGTDWLALSPVLSAGAAD